MAIRSIVPASGSARSTVTIPSLATGISLLYRQGKCHRSWRLGFGRHGQVKGYGEFRYTTSRKPWPYTRFRSSTLLAQVQDHAPHAPLDLMHGPAVAGRLLEELLDFGNNWQPRGVLVVENFGLVCHLHRGPPWGETCQLSRNVYPWEPLPANTDNP